MTADAADEWCRWYQTDRKYVESRPRSNPKAPVSEKGKQSHSDRVQANRPFDRSLFGAGPCTINRYAFLVALQSVPPTFSVDDINYLFIEYRQAPCLSFYPT